MILTVTLNAAIDKRYVVENFRLGEVNRVKECAYTPGGKGLNVSKPAAIAGEEVVATGFVGGHAGNYIEEALKPFGIRNVILDTSGALLTMGIEAKPTMIKPNLDEIRMLTGMSCDSLEEMIEAAKQIHEGGVEIVAVSLGAEGSFVVCEEGIYQAQVPKIDAVNTVGCGDSMIAGFAVGMSQKISVEGSLRLASAISAAAALREETGFRSRCQMQWQEQSAADTVCLTVRHVMEMKIRLERYSMRPLKRVW